MAIFQIVSFIYHGLYLYICSGDPLSNMQLDFINKEDAISFCEKNGEIFSMNTIVQTWVRN